MRDSRALVLSLVVAVSAAATPAFAATLTVTNTADSGPGSLRQAILDADANVGPDLIDFSLAPGQTIAPLTAFNLGSASDTTIDGDLGRRCPRRFRAAPCRRAGIR